MICLPSVTPYLSNNNLLLFYHVTCLSISLSLSLAPSLSLSLSNTNNNNNNNNVLEVMVQSGKGLVSFFCIQVRSFLYMSVTLTVPYMPTGLAGYSVDPEISCGARKLTMIPRVVKKKKTIVIPSNDLNRLKRVCQCITNYFLKYFLFENTLK